MQCVLLYFWNKSFHRPLLFMKIPSLISHYSMAFYRLLSLFLAPSLQGFVRNLSRWKSEFLFCSLFTWNASHKLSVYLFSLKSSTKISHVYNQISLKSAHGKKIIRSFCFPSFGFLEAYFEGKCVHLLERLSRIKIDLILTCPQKEAKKSNALKSISPSNCCQKSVICKNRTKLGKRSEFFLF